MTDQEILKVVKAHSEGKIIEWSYKYKDDWSETMRPIWDFQNLKYRIKPENEYRPYKNGREFMNAMKHHGPYIISDSLDSFIADRVQYDRVGWRNTEDNSSNWKTYEELLIENYEWQDGTPCGLLVSDD